MPNPAGTPPEVLEKATRNSRFENARKRCEEIVAAWPALSDEQLQILSLIFWPGDGQ